MAVKPREVWVTGWGAMTPLGKTAEASVKALMAGAACREKVGFFPTDGCRCREAAVVSLPDEKGDPRLPSRAVRLAHPALGEALERAGMLTGGKCRFPSVPLSISTTGGAMANGESFLARALEGKRLDQLHRVARYQPQQQILELQTAYGLEGPAQMLANACASGANAIGHGYDLIFAGFDCLQALSPTLCRPFDEKRDGLMLGEGAAFLILEEAGHARDRGVVPLARMIGYGHTTDLHHLTQPAPDGTALVRAMEAALACENREAGAVGYLNAHGTGTPMNDGAEAAAYVRVAGGRLVDGLKVSSTKAAIGHTLGAAGAVEAVFSLEAMRAGTLPPQLNVREPLTAMAGRLAAAGDRMRADKPLVMSVNLGFGGSNAALLFGPA